MSEPEEAIVDTIDSAHITGIAKSTTSEPIFTGNLVRGPVRPTAEGMTTGPSVFVAASGGMSAYPYLGIATLDRREMVQVVVRGEPKDYAGALALARLVFSAVHLAVVSGYWSVMCRGAAPAFVHNDEEQRSLFSFQVDLRRAA